MNEVKHAHGQAPESGWCEICGNPIIADVAGSHCENCANANEDFEAWAKKENEV